MELFEIVNAQLGWFGATAAPLVFVSVAMLVPLFLQFLQGNFLSSQSASVFFLPSLAATINHTITGSVHI